MLQHTPRSVIGEPPSLRILLPDEIDVAVVSDKNAVSIVGKREPSFE